MRRRLHPVEKLSPKQSDKAGVLKLGSTQDRVWAYDNPPSSPKQNLPRLFGDCYF